MTESATAQEMGLLHRYTAALKYSDFRRFWISATFAGAGVWGLIAARGVLAFDISDESSFWVGVTTFAALIPFVVVPPFSGVLADKFDRRYLIAIAHAINVLLALLLVQLYFTDTIELWHLPVISLLSGIARGVQMPTQNALVPNLVSRDDLLNAIALNNISLQGSRLVGGLSVLLLGWLSEASIGIAFGVAALGYAIATVMVLTIRTASSGEIARGDSIFTVFTAGIVYAWKTPTVGLMLIFVAFHCGLTMGFESVLPVHGTEQWGTDSALAAFLASFGLGAVFGVMIVAGIRSDRTKGIALLVAAAGSSVGVLILGLAPSQSPGLFGAFIMGLTQAPFMSLSITYIQTVVPDAIRGRVSSLFAMSALSLMAILNMV
ncbi:MAG: MFS transporter, partial [Chloroflexi bacterium]|nr:MFS transporter [Chloroflexota bacterium]